VHAPPDPAKLKAFADFARTLGYKIKQESDRFALQKLLDASADKPEAYAVHYALLRSLKQARYSPEEEGHYALASEDYCHFTSPIRRYPDLTVHRLLDRWLRAGRAHSPAGRRTRRRYGLGDRVCVEVVRVDVQRRQLDFRVCAPKKRKG